MSDLNRKRKAKVARGTRSIDSQHSALSASLTQEESCADVVWRDSPPDSPVVEEDDLDALLHVLKPEQARKRIRVDRVEDAAPGVSQATQHMSQFTSLLSHLPRSTPHSAVKSPRTDRESSSVDSARQRPVLTSSNHVQSVPSSSGSLHTSSCSTPSSHITATPTIHSAINPSRRSVPDWSLDPKKSKDALDALTADDLRLLTEMEKSVTQTVQVVEKSEGPESPFIDYDQLESVMQAAEEQFRCTQTLNFEEVAEHKSNVDIELATADEWQVLEALEMAAVNKSQMDIPLSSDNWLHEINSINCTRLRAVSISFQQSSEGCWFKEISAKRDYLLDEGIGEATQTDSDTVRVELWDDWFHSTISCDDVFHVINFNSHSSQSYFRVDGSSSLLILHPDILLTPTKIAEACDCSRRMVLAERYRGLNGDLSPLAVMGNVKHAFVEMYVDRYLDLKSQGCSFDTLSQQEIEDISHKAIANNCADLYTCKCSDDEVLASLKAITPLVAAWAKDGIRTIEGPILQRVHGICRHEVQGKEDAVWCPMLGIKGNIDMIIMTHVGANAYITPIELKTGKWRPNTAVAHRAQAILYVLMLLFRERCAQSFVNIAGALLLYINAEGNVTETKSDYIFPKWCDIRALMQSRNNLACFLHALNDSQRQTQGVRLPPVIRSPSCCEACFQAAECMHYHKAIEGGDEQSSGVPELFNYITSGIVDEDVSYLQHWERLLNLENASLSSRNQQLQIWTTPAAWKTSNSSGCMSNMMLIQWKHQGDKCDLTFHPTRESSCQLRNNFMFDIGDSVAVSVEHAVGDIEDLAAIRRSWDVSQTEPHIVSGQVIEANGNTVHILVLDTPKRLISMVETVSTGKKMFRLDRISYNSNLSTVRSNMYRLFSSGHNVRRYSSRDTSSGGGTILPRSARLRELVVLLKPPHFSPITCERIALFKPPNISNDTFAKVLKVLQKKRQIQRSEESMIICGVRIHAGCNPLALLEEYEKLNDDQRNAVDKVLMADDYVLLQGYPGSGKTQTVAFVIRALVSRNQQILVTSYTHSAVNHILEKLVLAGMQPSAIARLGSNTNVPPSLEKYTLQSSDTATIACLSSRLKDVNVFMCTVLTAARNAIVQSRAFDWALMDESGQISHPASLGPLLLCNRMLMVGDTHQLPPLVISKEAKDQGLEESLFKHLADHHPEAVVVLSTQYRMNSDILSLCNAIVYDNRLQCGSNSVATARMTVPKIDILSGLVTDHRRSWLYRSVHPNTAVLYLNTDQLSMNHMPTTRKNYNLQNMTSAIMTALLPGIDVESGLTSGKEVLLEKDTSKISGVVNPSEALIICAIVKALQQCGVDVANNLGIMSPYRAQVALLDQLLCNIDPLFASIACTIDTYQGRDRNIIILSTVRSNDGGDTGELLKDWRRINVAITRAKLKLIIIGSRACAEKIPILSNLIDHMVERKWILDVPSSFGVDIL